MGKIASIRAIEILDSRGNPTLQVSVKTDQGVVGMAAVPSGASTGECEAVELRDGDNSRYFGKGVLKAVENVNGTLAELLKGQSVLEQRAVDEMMIKADGTDNKGALGANAILGVSLAVARAGAITEGVPLYQYIGKKKDYILPCPMMNIINGGVHADNLLDCQEFMIRPRGASSFAEGVRMGAEVFHTLKKVLQKEGQVTSVGDEGGFAPNFSSYKEALDAICQAIEVAGYTPGDDVTLALDLAASWVYDTETGMYVEKKNKDKKTKSKKEQVEFLYDLCKKYPIDSIEDGMAENDLEGWKLITEKLGEDVQLVGDDNFVTNMSFLQKGIEEKVANSILIKVNQIGTLTESLDCIAMAKKNGYTTVVSHRSGETEDSFIADISVATGAGQIKTGSLSRSDRTAKYNRLLTIEDELGKHATYKDSNTYRGL